MTRGIAFVYLKREEDVKKVVEYVDGRTIRNRQVRAKRYLERSDRSDEK